MLSAKRAFAEKDYLCYQPEAGLLRRIICVTTKNGLVTNDYLCGQQKVGLIKCHQQKERLLRKIISMVR